MGTTRWINNYVKEFPIVQAKDDEQKTIIKLVERILTAKRANPQADTSKLESEIDVLVYQLYGLTKEEIDIVEGK
jgi:adenine-specific DNA-methyltransferase